MSSVVLVCGKNAATKPNKINAHSPPNRYGIHEVKSYLVWHAKSVSPTKIPAVRRTACRTILLSKNDTITDTEYASSPVKPAKKKRFIG